MAKRRNAITGQWAARSIEMLESPAYRTLSLSAHRALARIEIELAHHGGNDNGKLPVTFDDFVQYGVRRHSIGSSLDELETLGFIKITQHGKMAKGAEYRRPNLFLLATRPELEGVGPERCGWRRFQTLEEAERALERVRARRQNLKAASAETASKPSAETAPKAKSASAETAPLAMAETAPLSISRVGTPHIGKGNGTGQPRLTPTPAPPSPAVLWAEFSPSTPRRPAGIATAAPRKPNADAIVEPIDGDYLIGGRRVEIRDQTARRNVARLADFHERPARRTALPPNAQPADSAEQTVDIQTPHAPTSALVH